MMQRLDPKILAAFVTVAREGNVSRAAGILCLTQPAVSLQLRRLAQETGLVLFSRTARGLELTADGEVMLVKAERVLAALAEFGQAAQHLTQTLRGQLRIGTVIDPSFIRLGDFLKALIGVAPELRAELTQGMSGEVLLGLARGQLDLGYVLGPVSDLPMLAAQTGGAALPDTRLRIRRLTRFGYRVVAPAGWEARLEGRDWAGLAALPWIGTPPASVHSRLLARLLAPMGLALNQVTLADQEGSMLALVRAGVGLSLARESVALDAHQAHGLVLADVPPIETELAFAALEARAEEPAVALALALMDRVW